MMQLTYTSSATQEITPSLVIGMLESARRNNGPRHVSGLLYCAQGQFAQCLEGDVEDVEAIYAKIAADPRHTNLVANRSEGGSERAFKDWSMAFVDTTDAEVARVLLRHDTDSYQPSKWRRKEILPLLISFGQSLRAERITLRY